MPLISTIAGGEGPDSYQFTNITSATTTTCKSGTGTLIRIVVNRKIASGVITVYDNTAASGTKIATITNPATLLDNAQVFEYSVGFDNGLTIVTSSTDDITVVWR
jgi:hypothetical protein